MFPFDVEAAFKKFQTPAHDRHKIALDVQWNIKFIIDRGADTASRVRQALCDRENFYKHPGCIFAVFRVHRASGVCSGYLMQYRGTFAK